MEKLSEQIKQFGEALARLQEVLALPKNDVVRDSAIQRFEFTLDLAWKTIKTWLEESKGVICKSPKDCVQMAYQQKLINYNEQWFDLIDLRNKTSHAYNAKVAEEVYVKLTDALKLFQELLKSFK